MQNTSCLQRADRGLAMRSLLYVFSIGDRGLEMRSLQMIDEGDFLKTA
ncbi:hypothetical protein AB3R30_00315 [Leptolyngbyaceae cyanobacterium UHCC 1019]